MKRLIVSLLAVLVVPAPANAQEERPLALMPVPSSVTTNGGEAVINQSFRVATTVAHDGRLDRALVRFVTHLEHATGFAMAHSVSRDTTPVRNVPILVTTLIVERATSGATVQSVDEDESYTLDVAGHDSAETTGGVVHLRAATTVGVLRGLETLLQLVGGGQNGFYFAGSHIEDTPRFRWRGLLVDVSRHFESVEEMERTLDAMAAVKMNVLHWHLSDDQGIRVESVRFPLLQRKASDGLYYTRTQIRQIVAYARDRGIRVVPEFDMPGHSNAWMVAYPWLASGSGPYLIGRTWSGFTGTLDPTRESTFRFISAFVADMTPLFPDAYWHAGGDEVVGKEWNTTPRVLAFKKSHHFSDNAALQAYFNRRLSSILTAHGRRMIGWDEVLHPDLPRTTIIQSWRGTKYLAQAAAQGFTGILSAPYYLDAMKSAESHYLADPLAVGDTLLAPSAAASVLGGEAAMWSELVWPESIDSRIWPRTAAIAERFWSPASVRDVDDMYRRLWIESIRLESLGIESESHADRVLRQIVGGPEWTQLRPFIAAVEPVTLGQRLRYRRNLQMTPLVQLADAARPDPPLRSILQRWVIMLVASPASHPEIADSLTATFNEWVAAPDLVDMLALHAPLLNDGEPAARALAIAGRIGLELVRAERGKWRPAKSWTDSAAVTLKALDAPQGQLHIVGIPALSKLLSGVASRQM